MSQRSTTATVPAQKVRDVCPAVEPGLLPYVDAAARALAGADVWAMQGEPARAPYRRDAERALRAVEEARRAVLAQLA